MLILRHQTNIGYTKKKGIRLVLFKQKEEKKMNEYNRTKKVIRLKGPLGRIIKD